MGNIVLLDDLTINKIAAGEVIERPASVVKELMDNAIDAGATNITVEVKNGGISYIRITDNGKGIMPDDMEIAFERHATSKIRSAKDLETVKSMGFRGEALASIAAIARVEMTSRTADSEMGYRVVMEGGNLISKDEVGCPKGTTIVVENLFYNTPVRYKFLKKDFTELGYIEDSVKRAALVNTNVAFKLLNMGKSIIKTSGNGNKKDAVYSIFGREIADNIIDVEYNFEDMRISGCIGNGNVAKANRAQQLFFVNNRFVKDKTLTSAADQAFKGSVPAGKYGFLILNLSVDSHKLDVNVHPAKLEVRFQEETKIFKIVYQAIKNALTEKYKIDDDKKIDNNTNDGLNNDSNIGGNGTYKMRNFNDYTNSGSTGNLIEDLFNEKMKKMDLENSDSTCNKTDSFDTSLNYTFDSDKYSNDNESNVLDSLSNNEIDSLKYYKNDDVELDEKTIAENRKRVDEILQSYKKVNGEYVSINPVENNSNVSDDSLSGSQIENNSEANVNEMSYSNSELGKENTIGTNINSTNLENSNDNENSNITSENHVSKHEDDLGNGIQEHVSKHSVDGEDVNNMTTEQMINLVNSVTANSTILNESSDENSENTEKVIESNQENEFDEAFAEMYRKTFGIDRSAKDNNSTEIKKGEDSDELTMQNVDNENIKSHISSYMSIKYKFVGFAFSDFLVTEIEQNLYIISQEIAKERVIYENLKKNFYKDSSRECQLMLLPDIINVTSKQMDIAKDNECILKNAGFDFEEFGENTIKLNGVPNVCIDLETKDLFVEIIDSINTVARNAKDEIQEKFIATISAKVAEKSKKIVSFEEADALIRDLLQLDNPFMNVNGKSVAIKLSKGEIEKKFTKGK